MFWMLKGEKPAGRFGSVKLPFSVVTGLKLSSNTSILPLAKSAAYSRVCPVAVWAMARPVKTAPGTVAPTMALFLFTFGFQPEMVPSSPANRKKLVPDADPSEMVKPVPPVLKTVPVGLPLTLSGPGMLTTSGVALGFWGVGWGWGTPWPLYSVAVPVTWLA